MRPLIFGWVLNRSFDLSSRSIARAMNSWSHNSAFQMGPAIYMNVKSARENSLWGEGRRWETKRERERERKREKERDREIYTRNGLPHSSHVWPTGGPLGAKNLALGASRLLHPPNGWKCSAKHPVHSYTWDIFLENFGKERGVSVVRESEGGEGDTYRQLLLTSSADV